MTIYPPLTRPRRGRGFAICDLRLNHLQAVVVASRSEAVKLAVGFNPRLALEKTRAVAERRLNLKREIDGHEKAQEAQNEKGGVEKVAPDPVRVCADERPSLVPLLGGVRGGFCAFCAFSWLTAFSELNAIVMSESSRVAARRLSVCLSAVRGLKPTATIASSLRDAAGERA